MGDERVVGISSRAGRQVLRLCFNDFIQRASIPVIGADRTDGIHDAETKILTHAQSIAGVYGRNPSKIIWSAQRAARARSSSVRTVQVSSGRPSRERLVTGTGEGRSRTE